MLTEPIVAGAYYERYCGRIIGPFTPSLMRIYAELPPTELTRRVYLVPTDPAEILTYLVDETGVLERDSLVTDLVAEKLGVK